MSGNRRQQFIAAMLMYLVSGVIYGWSILSAPIRAEYPDWTESQFGLTYTISMLSFGAGQLLSGSLSQRMSPAVCIRIAAVLFLIGLTSVSFSGSVTGLYLLYGLFCGAATGFSYITILSSVLARYPDRKGLINGILLMVFGVSSTLIGLLYQAFTPEIPGGWRVSFRCMGAVIFLVYMVGSVCFRPNHSASESSSAADSAGRNVAPRELIGTKSFQMLFVWVICVSGTGMVIMSHAGGIVQEIDPGLTLNQSASITGLIFVASGLGRVSGGIVFEKWGAKRAFSLINLCFLLSQVMFLLAMAHGIDLCMIFGFLLGGYGYGCISPCNATLVSSYYGMKHYSSNLSIVNATLFLVAFSSTLAGMIFDWFQSYQIVYMLLLILLAAGCRCSNNLLRLIRQEIGTEY